MQMRRTMQWSPILIFLISIPIFVNGFPEEGQNRKMSLELLHRNDPRVAGIAKRGANNQNEGIKDIIHRDSRRRQRFHHRWGLHNTQSHRRKDSETFQMPMYSGRDYGLGEYFVQVEVGTPGHKYWLVADTGSEFTWFNCKNSTLRARGARRHKKRSRSRSRSKTRTRHRKRTRTRTRSNPCNRAFCPQRSRSFETLACSSQKCQVDLSPLFSLKYCPKPTDPCLYDMRYLDGSSAMGFFGSDTITVELTNGKKGKLQNLTIGCTKSMLNGVTFNEDTGGILGLGYARDSFVDKAALQYGGKFSYCLVDHLSHIDVSNYLTFGTPNVTLLGEMRRTELIVAPPVYGVNTVGISVGGQMLKIPSVAWDFNAQGGTVIDSGTTLTSLPLPAYQPVYEALTKSLTKVKRLIGDFGVLDYCFSPEGFDESAVPRLVFHFAGGVRFEPPVKSYIIDAAPDVKCIGIVSVMGPGPTIIGNIMQQNYLWEFDLSHNTVGFAPSACT